MELGTRKYIGRSFRWFDVSIQIQGMLPISFRIEVERNGLVAHWMLDTFGLVWRVVIFVNGKRDLLICTDDKVNKWNLHKKNNSDF